MAASISPSSEAKTCSRLLTGDSVLSARNAILNGRPLRTAGRPRKRPGEKPAARDAMERVQELEQLVGQLTLENRFFKGALQRIKQLRQRNAGTGAAASLRRSKP